MDLVVVQKLGLALALGLLVGLQRKWSAHSLAGIRTFALITILGTLLTMLAASVGGWLIVAGLAAVAFSITTGNVLHFLASREVPGRTTEIAALLMYAVGVALGYDQIAVALTVGGTAAVLLQWKKPLHSFVGRFAETDIRAIFQLVLIALVVLPVLPNKGYGPYGVLNPFEIWLMVVLIVGISVGGYMAYKFFGARAGSILGAILGGLISSTATTVSYSRRSRQAPETAATASFVIMIASTIVFARVIFEVAVVAPEILRQIAPPLAIMMATMGAIAVVLYGLRRGDADHLPMDEDPSQLKAAIVFGLLYAAVLFAVAAVKSHFDERGLFFVAALSGLTDMDAITLSTAQLIKRQELSVEMGWRMILVGALSNLVFKCAAVALLGHRKLLARIAVAFGISIAVGILLLIYWP